ncbi:branched-chain amino acid ABC transporter permease [Streptacidiphilus sp. ASG 303]|uniref:branched-chain amino acid ABC transporter permease n=1 Tax=Streptacidiphilus sp. ASG 303 TaxID=2896847 RepID=UPI001E57A81E|nr:branched-chain amino acid ABC transporter permease [Streptacidiphilus sp. ASG 303]MCD0485820.1 branched-chain amino acid ABC transporter permease [Streptacidiphilus sp. ASG 303]
MQAPTDNPADDASAAGSAGPSPLRRAARWWPAAVLLLLFTAPFSTLPLPGLLDGPPGSPGSLQLLALCMVFGALATGYDLLLGRTGLLSFGHALWFAAGLYATDIAMLELHLGLLPAALLGTAFAVLLALLLGSVSLRVTGIGFSMVTLAFAQAGSILVQRDPGGLTGGEEGRSVPADRLPGALVGIGNTANLYWIALGYLVLTLVVVHRAVHSPAGRVWEGIRENERRVEVLGLRPHGFKLAAFVLAAALAAVGGVVYLLVSGGATPQAATSDFTLSLLVMVVLGGSGTRWGPLLGGVLYTWADHRLGDLANSDAVRGLPAVLRVPLSQPLFLLGALFVAVVYLLPGGAVRLPARIREARAARSGRSARPERSGRSADRTDQPDQTADRTAGGTTA